MWVAPMTTWTIRTETDDLESVREMVEDQHNRGYMPGLKMRVVRGLAKNLSRKVAAAFTERCLGSSFGGQP
jgi:hypothetical protein